MSDEYTELVVQTDSNYQRDLLIQVELGIDAEKFLDSKLGRYLEGRAAESAMAAMQALKTVDPADSKTIQALQNAVFRAESFSMWLADCVTEGNQAEETLQEQQ